MRIHFELNEKCLRGCVDEPTAVKKVVVFIHDLNEHYSIYDEFALACCDNQIALVRFDLRGHRYACKNLNEETLAQDIVALKEFVKKRYSVSQIDMIGVGFGAWVAIKEGLKQSAWINRLLLISPTEYRLDLQDMQQIKKESLTQPQQISELFRIVDQRLKEKEYRFSTVFKKDKHYGSSLTCEQAQFVVSYVRKLKFSNYPPSTNATKVSIMSGEKDGLIEVELIEGMLERLTLAKLDIDGWFELPGQKHDCLLSSVGTQLVLSWII